MPSRGSLLFATLFLFIDGVRSYAVDPKGYVVYCPCMGRFGNQMDQTLGAFNFARSLDRTFVLPPFVNYEKISTPTMIAFEDIFQLKALEKFHRVIPMRDFMKDIAPKVWPEKERKVLCWTPRESIYDKSQPAGCHAKEGSPFGPFWDHSHVNFVGDVYYGDIPGGYDLSARGSRQEWLKRFPASEYPVLAFSGAPGAFPSKSEHWPLQRYFKWTSRIQGKAKTFVEKNLERPFVAVHLRNNVDWDRACEHVTPGRQMFASGHCLGEHGEKGNLTKEICNPSLKTIIENLQYEVGRIGAKSVFIASDKEHYIEELTQALSPYEVPVTKLGDDDAFVSLAILGLADHFLANCVSTFSAVAVREREFGSRGQHPTSFLGIQPAGRRRIEL